MCNEPTPIEALLATLSEDVVVDDVLIPEQCARIYLSDGRAYHVTIEAIQ